MSDEKPRRRFKRNFSIDHGAYAVVATDGRSADVRSINLKKDDAQEILFEEFKRNPKPSYFISRWKI